MISDSARRKFDHLLEQIIDDLPEHLLDLIEQVPVIVEDEPSRKLLAEMEIEEGDELCGLHTGVALTERSVEHSGVVPDHIYLFRGPIIRMSHEPESDGLREEIRVTLLHELGHHFGLDEDDLDELGYG